MKLLSGRTCDDTDTMVYGCFEKCPETWRFDTKVLQWSHLQILKKTFKQINVYRKLKKVETVWNLCAQCLREEKLNRTSPPLSKVTRILIGWEAGKSSDISSHLEFSSLILFMCSRTVVQLGTAVLTVSGYEGQYLLELTDWLTDWPTNRQTN